MKELKIDNPILQQTTAICLKLPQFSILEYGRNLRAQIDCTDIPKWVLDLLDDSYDITALVCIVDCGIKEEWAACVKSKCLNEVSEVIHPKIILYLHTLIKKQNNKQFNCTSILSLGKIH